MYGVEGYKDMIDNLSDVVEEEQYYNETLQNKTVKINPWTTETYRSSSNTSDKKMSSIIPVNSRMNALAE